MSSMGKGVTADHCNCCAGGAHTGVTASLEEMDFQRSLAGAAQAGDVGRMRGLLARGAKVDGDGDSGYTPLHYAARHGHVQACLLLLQGGAQVDRRTRAGQATSLHRAAYAGHIEVVKVLLQHGASVEAQDSDGQTCLHKASMQGHTAVVKLLKESCPRACTILDNQTPVVAKFCPWEIVSSQNTSVSRSSRTRGMEVSSETNKWRMVFNYLTYESSTTFLQNHIHYLRQSIAVSSNLVQPAACEIFLLQSALSLNAGFEENEQVGFSFLRQLSRGHLQHSRNEQTQLNTYKDPLPIMYATNFLTDFSRA